MRNGRSISLPKLRGSSRTQHITRLCCATAAVRRVYSARSVGFATGKSTLSDDVQFDQRVQRQQGLPATLQRSPARITSLGTVFWLLKHIPTDRNHTTTHATPETRIRKSIDSSSPGQHGRLRRHEVVWAIVRVDFQHTYAGKASLSSASHCIVLLYAADRLSAHGFFMLRLRSSRLPTEDGATGSASATGAASTDGADRELRILRRSSMLDHSTCRWFGRAFADNVGMTHVNSTRRMISSKGIRTYVPGSRMNCTSWMAALSIPRGGDHGGADRGEQRHVGGRHREGLQVRRPRPGQLLPLQRRRRPRPPVALCMQRTKMS